jgi:hypothetical protein
MINTPIAPKRARARALANAAAHTAEKLYVSAYKALSNGQSHDAMRTFLLMTGIVPFDARAWVGLGASLEQQGKWQRALGVYALGRTLAPTSVYCKLGEARVLAKLGRHNQAQCVLDTAEAHANHTHELELVSQLRAEL